MKLYDIHVATDVVADRAGRDALHARLVAAGFRDDELKENGLTFDEQTAALYATCPLIDIHMSKKVANRAECLSLEAQIHDLMTAAAPPGYWHSECVPEGYDRKIRRLMPVWNPQPWFCRKLRLNLDLTRHKIWDLHLAMKEDEVPEGMKKHLIDHGIYFLSRWKTREGRREAWAVFTVQGTSGAHEGFQFFDEIVRWPPTGRDIEYV
jgi:hypothetical protein